MIELMSVGHLTRYTPALALEINRFERDLPPDVGERFRRLLVAVDDEAVLATLADVQESS